MYIEKKDLSIRSSILLKIIMTFSGLVIGIMISRIFIIPFTVSDISMLPNFKIGDNVFIMRYLLPDVGDIVLIKSPVEPDKVLLKRVIAKDGDTIEIRNKIIYINQERLIIGWKTLSKDERIFPMYFSYRDNFPIVKIKRGQYFIIGDNQDYSFDSKNFGVVDEDMLIGRLLFKI